MTRRRARRAVFLGWAVVVAFSMPVAAGYTADLTTPSQAAGGAASASSNVFDLQPYKAFDNNPAYPAVPTNGETIWGSEFKVVGTPPDDGPQWLKYDFGADADDKKTIRRYRFLTSYNEGWWPDDWEFQGSNDDSNWYSLDSVTDAGLGRWVWYTSVDFDNFTAYRYYRIYITGVINDDGNEWVDINEMEMMEWTAAPEIHLQQGATDIADPGSYDFGDRRVGIDTDATFTITNQGDVNLTLEGTPILTLGGADPGEFSVQQQPTSPVAPLGSTTFILRFSPTSPGAKTATLSIDNDDSDEDPYNLLLEGTGTEPEIDVQGKGQSIPDGATSPQAADDTEFGSVDIAAGPVTHTFTIRNTGSADLTLDNAPNYASVDDPAFSVSAQPTTPVAPSGTTTFDVDFDPTAIGQVTATVTVRSDDANEDPYTFQVRGTGTAAPEIDIQGNGQSIPAGATNPQASDDTEFGSVDIAAGPVTHTFTIHNTGSADLTLGNAPNHAAVSDPAFSVSAQPTSPVTPSGSTTFGVDFDPSAVGQVTATVTVRSDDADEDPYTFQIRGTGTAVPEVDVQRPAGNSIADGGTDAQGSNVAGAQITLTYTARNTGSAALNVTNITSTNASNVSVDSISPTNFTVPSGGGAVTFEVKYTPTAAGAFGFELDIANDDGDEDPYDITVSGTVTDKGDISGDGVVDIIDARLCLQIAKGILPGTSDQRAAADVDNDGDVDMDDAIAIAEFIIGIRTTLP